MRRITGAVLFHYPAQCADFLGLCIEAGWREQAGRHAECASIESLSEHLLHMSKLAFVGGPVFHVAANPDFNSAEADLLAARILEAEGRLPEALSAYKRLSATHPGEEAKGRMALLLQRTGRSQDRRMRPHAEIVVRTPHRDLGADACCVR